MRLPVCIDVITISARIAIILTAGDHGSCDSTKNGSGNRTSRGSNAGNDRTDNSSGSTADYRAGSRTGNDVIASWCCCAPAE